MGTEIADEITGRIYLISSEYCDGVYVGSTTMTLARRMKAHKDSFKRYQNGKYSYNTSFDIIKHCDAQITLLHEAVFDGLPSLYRLEGEYIQSFENCVNQQIAGRTQKEYIADNRDKISQKKKQYRADNKEYFKEQTKAYRENNKEHLLAKHKCDVCGGCYATKHKSTHFKTKKHLEAVNKNKNNL